MREHYRRIQLVAIGIVAMLSVGDAMGVGAQTVTPEETIRSVRRMLERLPYYGVFDFIVFSVDRGTVTLAGYSYHASLKNDAEMAAARATGVREVANTIEVLPASHHDDRIRWATSIASIRMISCRATRPVACSACCRT